VAVVAVVLEPTDVEAALVVVAATVLVDWHDVALPVLHVLLSIAGPDSEATWLAP